MPLPIHTHPWHQRDHHDAPRGFQNRQMGERPASVLKAARWILHHAFQTKENAPPPVRPVDVAALHAPPERLRVTWIGHSSTLIQTPEANLLTDPIFSRRASPVPFAGPARHAPPPMEIRALPPIDAVLCSHDHYDHLDQASIEEIHRCFQPTFFAPLGVARALGRWGVEAVAEMDWWQYADFDGLRVHCTPAQHFSGRSLFDRNATLWASWYVEARAGEAPGLTFFYAGDSAYNGQYRAIRARLGAPDVALIPIGAYRPRWFMRPVHMGPREAVQTFLDLEAGHFIPVHWGTFDLAQESVDEPARRLRQHAARQGIADRLHILDIGQSFDLSATEADRAAPGHAAA